MLHGKKILLFFGAMVLFGTVAQAQPQGESLRASPVVRAVRAASPAVVNITSAKEARGRSPFGGVDEELGPLFRHFFDQPQFRGQPREQSLGSGVIVDGERGLVLTNTHVVAGASSIKVRLVDGREFAAELVGSEPDFDLAVLGLKGARGLTAVRMGDSDAIMIGETVIAIGNPFGYTHTVTTGVVSAVKRSLKTEQAAFTDFIQTDAAINPGNSGGPLLNILGELIGVCTAIHAKAEGIGFAIPVNRAKRVTAEILDHGKVDPIWFGLAGQDVDQRTARLYGLAAPKGMIVVEVFPGQAAEEAGLKPGDLLQSVNGAQVEDKAAFLNLARTFVRGETVEALVRRGQGDVKLRLKAREFTAAQAQSLAISRWGFGVESSGGGPVVTQVRGGSPADRIGLVKGDRILKINGIELGDGADFIRAVNRCHMDAAVGLLVGRGGRAYLVKMRT